MLRHGRWATFAVQALAIMDHKSGFDDAGKLRRSGIAIVLSITLSPQLPSLPDVLLLSALVATM